MKNCISINQKTNKIIIKINETAEHDEILNEIKQRISQLQKMYKNEQIPIFITGKLLLPNEMEEIKESMLVNLYNKYAK